MRASSFIFERIGDEGGNLTNLKQKVIKQVEITSDSDLLNKIYTSLNSVNLISRIAKGIADDSDIKSNLDEIVNIIIHTPGTYEEKLAFAENISSGYINISKMLSGERMHFADLIKSPSEEVSMEFLTKLFTSLKDVNSQAKGPGEYSLAVFSPLITIFGEGDLKIGKPWNVKIEVKASNGKLGTTGDLNHRNAPEIVNRYFGPDSPYKIPNFDVNKTLNVKTFGKLAKQYLPPEQRRALGDELFGDIFSEKNVDISPIVDAFVKGEDIIKPYTMAAYQAYKGSNDSIRFNGILLINFDRQELRYFDDFEEMYNDLDSVQANILTTNAGFRGRGNLPGLTLKAREIPKVGLPAKGSIGSDVDSMLTNFAIYMVNSARRRYPTNVKIGTPGFIEQVTATLKQLWGTVPHSKIAKEITKQYPDLVLKQAPPVNPAP
jgi:hypothetical protein